MALWDATHCRAPRRKAWARAAADPRRSDRSAARNTSVGSALPHQRLPIAAVLSGERQAECCRFAAFLPLREKQGRDWAVQGIPPHISDR